MGNFSKAVIARARKEGKLITTTDTHYGERSVKALNKMTLYHLSYLYYGINPDGNVQGFKYRHTRDNNCIQRLTLKEVRILMSEGKYTQAQDMK